MNRRILSASQDFVKARSIGRSFSERRRGLTRNVDRKDNPLSIGGNHGATGCTGSREERANVRAISFGDVQACTLGEYQVSFRKVIDPISSLNRTQTSRLSRGEWY